jgi:hypothetical protein
MCHHEGKDFSIEVPMLYEKRLTSPCDPKASLLLFSMSLLAVTSGPMQKKRYVARQERMGVLSTGLGSAHLTRKKCVMPWKSLPRKSARSISPQVCHCRISHSTSTTLLTKASRNRLCNAQGPLCVPYHRRQKN